MDSRSLDKAMDVVSELINNHSISKKDPKTTSLYEEFNSNPEVYDIVNMVLKKMNIDIYEYNNSIYVTAGINNKVFGFSNEEIKKEIGVKLNKELYLCYLIIYVIINKFYNDSVTPTFVEYIKIDELIKSVDACLLSITSKLEVFSLDEVEENSFKEIAMTWENLPVINSEDTNEASIRAARGTKAGFVKLVLNFMLNQKLLLDNNNLYYPTEKFKCLSENYFEEYKGKLSLIMRGDTTNATY